MEVAIETAADGGRTGGENLRRNCPVDESYYLYFVLQQGNIFARSINLELLGRKFGDCLRAGKVFKSLACIMVGIKKNSGRIRGTKFKLPGGLVNRLYVQPIFGSNSAFFLHFLCVSRPEMPSKRNDFAMSVQPMKNRRCLHEPISIQITWNVLECSRMF